MIFTPENTEIFYRLLIAVFFGSLIGFERKLAHKTAGMRTFALVCFGASLFTVISEVAFLDYVGKPGFDPSRIASQIVVGIGFLGAGLIIFKEKESKVRGLTTAAGLWVTAGIGMATGYGLYPLAIFATLLTLIVFLLLWLLEHYIVGRLPFQYHEHDKSEESEL